jgi:protein MpaA
MPAAVALRTRPVVRAGAALACLMIAGCVPASPSSAAGHADAATKRTGTETVPTRRATASHAPTTSTATPANTVERTVVFGHSVSGAALTAVELGDPQLPVVLVIGCIHGNEPSGTAVIDQLLRAGPTAGIHLWLVRTLNPDGQQAGTRGNAHGVDLNRNFPDRWQPLDPHGGPNDAGLAPLSEPESAAMATLVRQIRPRVGIWFHQALNVIDISQGPRLVEDRLASALGVREQALPDYPGSAIGYEDQLLPASAFAFELPAGALTPGRAGQIATAILTVSRELSSTP